jgi:hypothetical protein
MKKSFGNPYCIVFPKTKLGRDGRWVGPFQNCVRQHTHPGTIPARFGLIWFSVFRGEDLNVIFYQNMPNLHNRYKSAERKISQKNK